MTDDQKAPPAPAPPTAAEIREEVTAEVVRHVSAAKNHLRHLSEITHDALDGHVAAEGHARLLEAALGRRDLEPDREVVSIPRNALNALIRSHHENWDYVYALHRVSPESDRETVADWIDRNWPGARDDSVEFCCSDLEKR